MDFETFVLVSSYLFIVTTLSILSVVILLALKWRSEAGTGIVSVVVLGDIGRSPRMQYHTIAMAQFGFEVDLVGFAGSTPLKKLTESSAVKVHHLATTPRIIENQPATRRYLAKAVFQAVNLLWILLRHTRKSKVCVVQNPPAIPSLSVVWLACVLRGTKMVIDWHNYGYTIMALAQGEDSPLVKVARWYEGFFGARSHHNLCVTDAMKLDLEWRWGVKAIILYDRPHEQFTPISVEQQHELFIRLGQSVSDFAGSPLPSNQEPAGMELTAFTQKHLDSCTVNLRKDRPFLVVSSTSWTEDEDFSILIRALDVYEKSAQEIGSSLPHITCVITGKGPLKAYYEGEIAKKDWTKVTVCTLWLQAEDYPLLLASADLGVSLHTSSSGLDLPMKVVDMFGCGLPVCAMQFKCVHELVQHNHNGLVFSTAEDLVEHFKTLAYKFPEANYKLSKFRENLISFQSLGWSHYWKMHVRPLLY